MSNGERDPREVLAAPGTCEAALEVLTPREVPLGGPRAMHVRRTLPQRRRSLIGPWCFVDHFGPDDVAATGGMAVPRHPHTGLATVTLLFAGHIDHRDSTGFANTVRPGEVNLMIAGHGVSHSEFSTADTHVLHGVQLWYALPDAQRDGPARSQHHVAELVELPGGAVLPYLGEIAGGSSPIDTRTPALAAEIQVLPGQSLELELEARCEHGLLLDAGDVQVEAVGAAAPADSVRPASQRLSPGDLLYLPPGAVRIRLRAGDGPARAILVGGPPFGEEIVMWWNFVGRSHEEIVAFRETWQREISADAASTVPAPGAPDGSRFGPFPAGTPAPLPAPALPNVQIRPRQNPTGGPR